MNDHQHRIWIGGVEYLTEEPYHLEEDIPSSQSSVSEENTKDSLYDVVQEWLGLEQTHPNRDQCRFPHPVIPSTFCQLPPKHEGQHHAERYWPHPHLVTTNSTIETDTDSIPEGPTPSGYRKLAPNEDIKSFKYESWFDGQNYYVPIIMPEYGYCPECGRSKAENHRNDCSRREVKSE